MSVESVFQLRTWSGEEWVWRRVGAGGGCSATVEMRVI